MLCEKPQHCYLEAVSVAYFVLGDLLKCIQKLIILGVSFSAGVFAFVANGLGIIRGA